MSRTSVKAAARRAFAADAKARVTDERAKVNDSFVNFAHNMGIGADNPLSSASYSFNPITRNRTMLEWIHRGSWLGGVAIDVVADDLTRAGVELQGTIKPEDMAAIETSVTELGAWVGINRTAKWARLYGGAIGVMLLDGQDPSTPLKPDRIGKGMFRGVMPFDRWMIEPSLDDLVKDMGPHLGQPKFYKVLADAPAFRGETIHYTRCLRLEGLELPYQQRLQEQLWGLSVLERVYDRMVAFDSATTGAAQLVYKCYLRTFKVKNLREVVSSGGQFLAGLRAYTDFVRKYQGMEGVTLIDGDDEFETSEHGAFGGLSEALVQFGQQLSGALQIPLVRLFGQSPSGMNSTGESDLRMYYDNIKQTQEKELRRPLTTMYRMAAASLGIRLDEGFRIEFRPLWQLQEGEKATIADQVVTAVTQAQGAGLITDQVAVKELRQSSRITGIFSNITDEDIEAANAELPPTPQELMQQGIDPNTGMPMQQQGDDPGADPNATTDSAMTMDSEIAALEKRLAALRERHAVLRERQLSSTAMLNGAHTAN